MQIFTIVDRTICEKETNSLFNIVKLLFKYDYFQ